MRLHSVRLTTSAPIILLALILIAVSITSIFVVEKEKTEMKHHTENYFVALSMVLNADRDLYQALVARTELLHHDEGMAESQASFQENSKQVKDRFHLFLKAMEVDAEIVAPFDAKFDKLYDQWQEHEKALLAAHSNGQSVVNEEQQADASFAAIRALLDQAGTTIDERSTAIGKANIEEIEQAETMSWIVITIGLLVAAVLGYIIPYHISRRVTRLASRIREIADGDGDLTQKIDSSAQDELGDLANEFDHFVECLRSIISNIRQESSSLGGMTSSLHEASERTAGVTNTLVNASNSIVSAAHQMNASNQQMADAAKDTASESQTSNELTDQGIKAVNSSHEAIDSLVGDINTALSRATELEKSSEDIASVLEVIRNIAEQTNLLALNAAIEAARAGEQGRGFAVVADEVRTLATRTQDSTNEIETMIEQLKKNVQESSRAIQNSRSNADTTVENFDEVIRIFGSLQESFAKVQEMAAQTAQATEEQSHMSVEINENLEAMKSQTDEVQSVSELVQSHSRQISNLYQELDAQVGSFKV